MLTQIFPFEDNACDAKEVFSTMDPNCEVDTLSVSLQSCEPFSATGLDLGKSFNEPDIPIADGVLGDFKSIVVTSSSVERVDDGVDTIRINDVSETKSPEIIPLSTRRSTRKSVLKQKIDTKRVGRKCRQTSDRRRMLDIVFLTVARKRRSFLYKRARFSSWGLLQNIINVFGQHAGKSTDQNIHSGSEKGRTIMRGEKSDENQMLESLQRSKDETQVKSGGILLKFKLRNKTIQSCQLNTIPVMDRDVQLYREIKIESPNSEHNMVNKLEEALPRNLSSQCFNENVNKAVVVSESSVLDPLVGDKERSENIIEKGGDNNGVSSKEGMRVGERVECGCLDPGTSPDSEVINLTPETQINGVSSEDVLDILVPSQGYVAPGDVTSLIQTSKKGNKESNICQIGNFEVEGGVPSPEIIDAVVLCDKNGQKEEMGDGAYSNGASLSTTFGVASSNASSSDGCPVETLAFSRKTDVGSASEVLEDEPGEQVHIGVGVEPLDLRLSDKLLPPGTKGQKLKKSSSSSKKSEIPDSVNKKQTTSRKKGLERKSTTKGKTKEKNGNDHVGCHVQSDPQIGNDRLDDIRELKEGRIATGGDLSSSSMISSGVEDQHFPPRNAWVCCDECHKWRRIPAILADSIEATDCRWVCEDNMDKTFANCSIPQEKSNAKINEELEISDAEEDGYSARLSSGRLGQKQTSDKPPSSWKLIRSNLFLHRHRKNQPIDEIMVCHCKPPLDGRSGCRDGCLNRMLNIECVKGTCPCGELCSNQQFQKRKYAKLKCFRCGKKGYGLQLQEDIPKGRFLIEYVGEVLDMHAHGARQREYASKGHKHFYFMTLNGSEVIDACAKGNLGRFINHSCEPNCRTEKWMVNGEVCIGLFALRDIKKGEELTFDYNYVRVFGAAAKKCVCGSSKCRGFIGGDPENAETVIQSDSDEEFPEPVMLYEDGTDKLDSTISVTISSAGVGLQSTENPYRMVDELDNSAVEARQLDDTVSKQTSSSLLGDGNGDSRTASGYLEDATESSDFCAKSPPIASKSDTSLNVEAAEGPIPFSVQPINPSLQSHDEKSEIIFESPLETDEDVKQPVCTVERTETSSMRSSVSNLLPSTADTKKKPKTPTDENARTVMKPHRRTKISRPPSSMKKGKPKTNAVIMTKPPEVENKALPGPCRPKKQVEDTLGGRFEAVQETLTNLLDADGGISKRRDASRGYLKLLYLTAASGGSGSGEGIQSNRDLSMILDGLLKTKSRTVLVDIINKNGLQMLHNIMKRYRKEFNKIPILRKLLKVLEYLAERRILTLENITRAPPHDGVESFRESILSLTEHIDKQVHQIARNFRDRWIPRAFRKINCIDRDVDGMEIQKCLNFSKFPVSQDHSCSQDGKQKETIDDCGKQSPIMHDTPQVDAGTVDGSSASCCSTDGTISRKRKTRWDQPADAGKDSLISQPNKECRTGNGEARSSQQGMETSVVMCEEKQNISDDDAPPGFSSPLNAKSSIATDFEAVAGCPQERFNSRLSISYGVPLAILGTHQPATGESWFEASAIHFYPFPPLPSYPRPLNCGTVIQNQSIPTTSGASPNPPDVAILPFNHQHNFQRFRGSSLNNNLGRRYFRQQKWTHPRYGAPWSSRKNDGGRFMEANNSNYGVGINGNEQQPKDPYGSLEVERCGSGFYQPEQ